LFPKGLVEISPVDTGSVAIKGVASSRFLCMDRRGKLYGSVGLTITKMYNNKDVHS